MEKEILQVLKEKKIKITNERQEIISVLEKSSFPLSPADIFLSVTIKLPKANLTTIYRNLEMFEGYGLIKRVGFNKTNFFYEIVTNRPHHHHIVCRNCGKVEDLENISEKFVSEVSKATNFKVQDHNLEFFGLCSSCQRKKI